VSKKKKSPKKPKHLKQLTRPFEGCDYGEALLYTPFCGYGDLLYHTPLIRVLDKIFKGVDVWTFNPEPFKHNPHIKNLMKINSEHDPEPWDFYGENVFHLSPARNPTCRHLYQANNHMVDYLTNSAMGLSLRSNEKNLVLQWSDATRSKVWALLIQHGIADDPFVVVNPVHGWPSRTLPLDFYQEIIQKFQDDGLKVVLVGKDVDPTDFVPDDNTVEDVIDREVKGLYPSHVFPDVIDLTNKLSFHECCCLYSYAAVALNTENGNMVMSSTNNHCWNLYIPSLTAPEFRLPHRFGDMNYRSTVVGNGGNYYPGSDYVTLRGEIDFVNSEVVFPSVNEVWHQYVSHKDKILEGTSWKGLC